MPTSRGWRCPLPYQCNSGLTPYRSTWKQNSLSVNRWFSQVLRNDDEKQRVEEPSKNMIEEVQISEDRVLLLLSICDRDLLEHIRQAMYHIKDGFSRQLLVEECEYNDRHRGEDNVVELWHPLIVDVLTAHSAEKVKPHVSTDPRLVLIEVEENKFAILSQSFLSHVQDESVQVTELAHRKICALRSFASL